MNDEQLTLIKRWLGTGSINIFGLPMSGKDTQGARLAEALGAKLLSSGDIIREKEAATKQNFTGNGDLAPTNVFYDWVLPYFANDELKNSPLVLSSIGRWQGEEVEVIKTASATGHEIKAVILLNISEADVLARYEAAKVLSDRGTRQDDADRAVFKHRLDEFRIKTMPVVQHYQALGLLVNVNGDQIRDAVTAEIFAKLYELALKSLA